MLVVLRQEESQIRHLGIVVDGSPWSNVMLGRSYGIHMVPVTQRVAMAF
jgi:hypothetical protein